MIFLCGYHAHIVRRLLLHKWLPNFRIVVSTSSASLCGCALGGTSHSARPRFWAEERIRCEHREMLCLFGGHHAGGLRRTLTMPTD
jgi:hypothetical protein